MMMGSEGEGLGHFSPQSIDAIVLNDHIACVKLSEEGQDIPLPHANIPELSCYLSSSLSFLLNFGYHQHKACIGVESTSKTKYLFAFLPPKI